ncbi:MAG TPA: SIR2 family protein, partial [Telluria sp.]
MKEIVEGNVAIFAGAGVSTESRMVFKKTFYEDVMVYLGMNYPYERLNDANFPSLMQHLSSKPSGRIKLLEMIIKRFRTIDSFPELYGTATRFHRELGTLFPIKTIITTNWDEYFERECKATPFVYDHDMPFWQAARRKVLKIHGSITNLGSIIADREDYDRCTKELSTSLIGSKLKIILSEQTVVFIGYSLSDPDFMSVFDFVKGQIGRFQRQHYVVTPFENEAQRFRELGLIPIVTDGTYFIHVIKKQDGLSECLVKDSYEELAMTLRSRVLIEHNRLHSSVDFSFHPDAVYASFYQDGLMHALERSISMKGSGEYSHTCDLRELVKKYEEIAERKLSLG